MEEEKDRAGKGYALWLMPEEPMFHLLAGRIARLSQEFSAPLFEPHLTLLAGIMLPEEESAAKCSWLADRLKPVRLVLGEIGNTGDYFRCVFASIVPGEPIMHAHRMARDAFNFRDDTVYTPHLSLLYGYLQNEKRKGIATAHSFLSGQAFDVQRLVLYRVTGTPDEWKRVREFGLK